MLLRIAQMIELGGQGTGYKMIVGGELKLRCNFVERLRCGEREEVRLSALSRPRRGG